MKPAAVQALIDDLIAEISESSVGSTPESYATVESSKPQFSFTLTPEECAVVFHSRLTVEQFHEALGYPKEASVEMHELVLTADALEAVERAFSAVDET